MKKVGLLVLVMLDFAQVSGTAADYSKMSAKELNEALIISVKEGSYDEVQNLVRAGANGNQKITYTKSNYDDYDSNITCTLLEYAAKHGYVDIVKELIVKAKNDDINTALILAAKEGHANVVRELVQAKPKVDAINTAFISSARNFPGITTNPSSGRLDRTALKDYLNVIKELIKAGANVNHTDEFGNTALIEIIECSLYTEAQKKNRGEVIQALLKAKANVNHANKISDTALIRAIQKHDFDAVQILLKVPRIKTNHANNDGNTALIVALQCLQYTYVTGDEEQYNNCVNSQKILEKLLQTPGINPHHVNKNGDTAINLLEKVKSRLA
jgi:ankyrin repeat protein